jgi:hypothetical protein
MKRASIPLLSVLIIGLSVLRCENEDQNVSAKITNDPECKSSKSAGLVSNIPDTLSCVYYSYQQPEEKLVLKHVNAGFNCCPGKLSCMARISGDTILLKESEESYLCDCDCLFDLEIEVTGISAGQYIVKFSEPYCGTQKKILFEVNFMEEPEGSFCVIRKLYPWGMGL